MEAQRNPDAAAAFVAEGAFDPPATRAALAALDAPVLVLAGGWDVGNPRESWPRWLNSSSGAARRPARSRSLSLGGSRCPVPPADYILPARVTQLRRQRRASRAARHRLTGIGGGQTHLWAA